MKCIHLQHAPVLNQMGITFSMDIGNMPYILHARDAIFCNAKLIDNCPKKKQPCEINARCWRIGK